MTSRLPLCLALVIGHLIPPLLAEQQPAPTTSLAGDEGSRPPHVVVISIDGLMPSVYTQPGPSRVPALRRLAQQGAWAEGVVGVLPSVTYPSHTSIVTGVPPAAHGVYNNRILDAARESGSAWYWHARDVRVPTLPGAVRSRGLSAAAVSWPVTVDADLDVLLPEYGRPYTETLDLLRALSRPRRLLDTYEAARGEPLGWPLTDGDRMGLAAWIFRTYRPQLLLVHIFENDSAHHEFGPGSPQALAALEASDAHVSLMLDAVADAGLSDRTNVVIVSDHGFIRYGRQLHPNAAFRQEALLDVDLTGAVTRWDAYFQGAGGSGFVYLRARDDAGLRARVEAILQRLAANPANGIRQVLEKDRLRELGADPRASFALDMQPGFATGDGHDALVTASTSAAGHGYHPAREEMYASLIMAGPDVPRTGSLGVVRMTQVAPTIASWFGVGLSPGADEPLSFGPAVPQGGADALGTRPSVVD